MPSFDVQAVKQAAAGRWPEIFAAVGSADHNSFDGNHQPCPKCGGKDRFRLIDAEAGACICNQCLTEKNGDGLAVIQWLTGDDFARSLERVAGHLGIKPKKQRGKADPAEHLEFLPWNPTLVGLWCREKPPIKPEAVQAVGGRYARYRGQYSVIAIPIMGPGFAKGEVVGWVLYRSDGGKLPRWKKGQADPEWKKVLITYGSQAGIICDPKAFELPGKVFKVEGPPDLLALMSMTPEPICCFTNGSGAQEAPKEWIIELCRDRVVIVIHDADDAGQAGATWLPSRDGSKKPGWCPRLASVANQVINARLPFPQEKTSGPDLRDFFNGGGRFDDLAELIGNGEKFTADQAAVPEIEEAPDDPQRLARINLEKYKNEHDGKLVYWRDEWRKWKGGRYRQIEISELRHKVWHAVRQEFEQCWRERRAGDDAPVMKVSRNLVSNVIGAMESMCGLSSSIPMPSWLPDRSRPHYVAALNGILNLEAVFEGKEDFLLPHSADWFSDFRLDYPFDHQAKCDRWEECLAYAMEGDKERIHLLQEWAGYLLTNQNYLQRFLVLEGGGSNGKTVFFAGMIAMLGEDNVSHVTLENFGGRFELASTIGKACNISADASGQVDSIAEGVVKQFTGGDVMLFDRKNRAPISARPTAKLMAAWNDRPKIRDKSEGLWRRMLLVPFNRPIPESRKIYGMDQPDWWIKSGEAPGILNWAIAGLARLREQGDFTASRVSEEATDDYRIDSNPVKEFFTSYLQEMTEGGIDSEKLYELYTHWARKNGNRPFGNRQFGKELKREFPKSKRKRVREGKILKYRYEGLQFTTDEIFSQSTNGEKFFI